VRFTPPTHRRRAFALPELAITVCIILAAIGGTMVLGMAHLRLVNSSRQSSAATLSLGERIEQVRLTEWRKITDAEYLKDIVLANPAPSAGPLKVISERVVVSAYPNPSAAGRLVVERTTNGERVVKESGDGLTSQSLAQVEFQVSWGDGDEAPQTQTTTTLISNRGDGRKSLVASSLGNGRFYGLMAPARHNSHDLADVGDKSDNR
jgi:hypothetical protein